MVHLMQRINRRILFCWTLGPCHQGGLSGGLSRGLELATCSLECTPYVLNCSTGWLGESQLVFLKLSIMYFFWYPTCLSTDLVWSMSGNQSFPGKCLLFLALLKVGLEPPFGDWEADLGYSWSSCLQPSIPCLKATKQALLSLKYNTS